jgi:hypothetical protein
MSHDEEEDMEEEEPGEEETGDTTGQINEGAV